MDRQKLLSVIKWAVIGLLLVVVINMAIILIRGILQPSQILNALSIIAFFEAGFFLFIGGMALMIGGYPSIGKALNKEWTPEKGKETRQLSYTPLTLAGFLFLVSILTSLLA